jgi:putative DNA primase/helicase
MVAVGTACGNNGKTTLLEIIRSVLGPYAGQIDIDSLLEKSKTFSNVIAAADLADLCGCRFATASEPPAGARLQWSNR